MPSPLVFCNSLHEIDWLPYPSHSGRPDLSVFRLRISQFNVVIDYLHSLLNPDEALRRDRYRLVIDQHRFVITRGILRVLVGHYANQRPSDVEFTIGLNKKPQLKDHDNLHYNVSHSGDWALIGIANRVLGIDVEKVDPDFFFQDIVAHSFNPFEKRYLESNNNDPVLFYQLWTRKEALVKATGKGIDGDFDQIPSLDGEHQLTKEQTDKSWIVSSFNVTENYLATVAYPIEISAISINFYNVDSFLFNNR